MRQCRVVKVWGGVNYCGRDGHHTLLKVICNKMRPVNQQMVIVVSRAGSARFTTSIRPSLQHELFGKDNRGFPRVPPTRPVLLWTVYSSLKTVPLEAVTDSAWTCLRKRGHHCPRALCVNTPWRARPARAETACKILSQEGDDLGRVTWIPGRKPCRSRPQSPGQGRDLLITCKYWLE